MAEEDSEPKIMSSELLGTHITIGKMMENPEFKRSRIGLIAEFHGISNGFPNLGAVCVLKLDRYLHDVINKQACPLFDADDAFNDPLKWWKESCTKYPYVANIARKYLAIHATSAPSEGVWSCLAEKCLQGMHI
jgi:hypothetical protein